jgi:predicted ATPase
MARLDRLPTGREVAQLGSVIGREFSHELLQALVPTDEATLQVGTAELVEAEVLYQRGRPPRATYMFKHALIQDAAYASLLKRTRQQMHQQIAQMLESQFPEMAQTQPELVAHHCAEADCPEQAIDYWQQAGERAGQRSAYTEAIAHLTRGLAVLETLPETTARADREIRMRLTLGRPLISAKGNAAAEAGHLYTRVRELCRQRGELSLHFAALHGLRVFHTACAEHRQAAEIGKEALRVAQRAQDPGPLAEAYLDVGVPLLYRGEFRSAIENFRQSLIYADVQHDTSVSYSLGGPAAGVVSRAHATVALWMLGYPEQARQWCQEALTLSQRFTNPRIQAMVQWWALILYAACGAWPILYEAAGHHVTFSTEHGLPWMANLGTTMLGWWRVVQAHDRAGITQLRQGVRASQGAGIGVYQPYWLALLAEADAQVGQPEDGLTALEESFAVMHATEEYLHHAELHRIKGTLLLACSEDRHAEAEACYHQALDVARRQQAKSWELRAATSLARLWKSKNKRQEAYHLLVPVYNWFTEGFDTADLQEAKALLQELAQ